MKKPSLDAQAGALWSQLWSMFYQVNDNDMANQGPRVREICRLAAALAPVCDAIKSEREKR